MFDINGKRCIVTGGAMGIGNAIVKKICSLGGKVCIADIQEDEGRKAIDQIVDELAVPKDSIIFKKCDVAKKSDWKSMWDEAERDLGGKIELLVNNAGVFAETIDPEFRLDINVNGVVMGCSLALSRMDTSKGGLGGRVVNVASLAGLAIFGENEHINYYTMSKYGVVTLTRGLGMSSEVAKGMGVKLYCLCPYFVDTKLCRDLPWTEVANDKHCKSYDDFFQKNPRALQPDEVAKAFETSLKLDKNGACFAISPDSSLLEYSFLDNTLFPFQVLVAKMMGKLGVEVTRPYHTFLALIGLMFLLLFVLNFIYEEIID